EDGDLQVRALHTLQTFGLSASAPFPEVLSFETLFPRIGTKGMRPLQHACAAIACQAPMLTILEAPMGEGKTEAALYLATQLIEAYGLHGLYVALPTAATSNQMHARVGAMLEGLGMGEARLMHGMAWLLDAVCDVSQVRSEDAEAIRAWLAPLRRAMLSENAVGTVDQAMLAAMQAKYGVLRLIGLMNKVLIIDEVHAYDAYMSQILEGLLSWCHVLGIPVLLLSATLQSAKKRDFLNAYDAHVPPCLQDAYPLVTYVQADGTVVEMDVPNPHMHRSYRFAVVPHLGDAPFIAEMAASLVAQGGCLCVMLNTIAEAQEVYCALKELAFEEVLLFHARFEADRRNALEREVVALFGKDGHRPQRAILVCTQVVEQSLDLDFDAMITAIAPMDLLMQRAGRVQRHDGRLRPVAFQGSVIYVLTPKEQGKYGGTGAVYAECFLERTRAFLGDGQCVAVPEDMRGCIESVYGKPVAKEEMLDERWLKFFFQTDDEKAQAQAAMLPDPQPCSFFPTEQMDVFMQTDDENSRFRAVHTRIGTPSTRVALVKRHEIEYLLKNPFDLLFSLEIYGRTFAINVELYDNILHQSKDVVEGKGHLRGCLLLLAPEGVFSCKSCRIVHDPILGGKIEKGA
ncbi:MAG: CRISPR-associated helicase Cas3', partial [Clostridia bacterium]